jgi:regulator of sigma E protease
MNPVSLIGVTLLGVDFGFFGDVVIGILGFVAAFGLAVFIHELGHFLGAKIFGVPVERFVIGMDREAMGFLPRCIWERKIGETTYGISLVPFGGYVKMAGTVHPDIEKYLDGDGKDAKPAPVDSKDARPDGPPRPTAAKATPSLQEQAMGDMAALYRKPFWQKVIIYGAGVFMNMVLATAVMTFLLAKGTEESAPYPARVAWIAPDSTFASTALRAGDWIVGVNGAQVADTDELSTEISSLLKGKTLAELGSLSFNLDLQRRNEDGSVAEAYQYPVTLKDGDEPGIRDFYRVFYVMEPYIDFVNPNTPASKAGLRHGDVVASINGERVADWTHFRYLIEGSANKELDVVVVRKGAEVKVKLTPWEDAERPGVGQVGVVPGNAKKIINRLPLGEALLVAPVRVYDYAVNYVMRLGQLGKRATEGNVTAVRRELGGPVGIAQVAYKMAQKGFDDWLKFLIILNVALAVMNILPFPVLDGGHICFAAYEGIFRKPVPPQVLVPLLNGAVVVILIFFVLVTFNDVLKIFT